MVFLNRIHHILDDSLGGYQCSSLVRLGKEKHKTEHSAGKKIIIQNLRSLCWISFILSEISCHF